MRMGVLIAVVTGIFVLNTSSLLAGKSPGSAKGWVATPSLHVKGQGPVKNFGPNYISGYGYRPSEIKAAYGISGSGAGQTIAIVDAYGSLTMYEDLAAFCQAFGLPQASLTIYHPGGWPQSYDPDWALETSLDVEWAHALAPRANIALVIAASNSDEDLLGAVQYAAQTLHAQVVIMSWSGDEFSDETSYDSYFQNSGTVFIASSGDYGSGAQYPAASPYVVAAGGTALYLKKNTGTRKFPEVAWGGSGGGVSQYEPMPLYQTQLGITASGRCVPDVSFVADPNTGALVYDSNYDPSSNWWVIGGTSLAAPCWSAVVALANQLRASTGRVPLTDGHQALYDPATSAANYQKCYFDITMGYNGDFAAKAGYDNITGLGCPRARKLIQALKLYQP